MDAAREIAEATPAANKHPGAANIRAGRLSKAQKRNKILALRAAGGTHEQIAEVLTKQGHRTTPSAVTRMLNKALEDLATEDLARVEQVRALQLERLDRMVAKLWPRVMEGNIKAIAEVRNIEQLRAKIAGTEAPRKIEHSGSVDHRVSREEVAQLERAWIDSTADDLPVEDAQLVSG